MAAKKYVITLSQELADQLDEMIKSGKYISRSEAIRDAIRNLERSKW